jgi:hypothetical protein
MTKNREILIVVILLLKLIECKSEDDDCEVKYCVQCELKKYCSKCNILFKLSNNKLCILDELRIVILVLTVIILSMLIFVIWKFKRDRNLKTM